MSMIFADSRGGFGSFVATDLRHVTCRPGTGEINATADRGGKLAATPHGWAVGAGASRPVNVAFQALQSGDVYEVPRALEAAGCPPSARKPTQRFAMLQGGGQMITESLPDDVPDPNRISLYVVDSRRSSSFTYSDGVLVTRQDGGLRMALPHGTPSEESDAMTARCAIEIFQLNTLPERIRIAARYFAEVGLTSARISSAIEFGYVTSDGARGFLRGDSAEIAATDPSVIFERFAAEPLENVPHGAQTLPTNEHFQFNPQGSVMPVPTLLAPFSYNSGGPAAGRMWIAFSWSAITAYRPDGTTVVIPASASYATPPSPTLSTFVLGALGLRTVYVRIGYIKNNVMHRVGAEASISCPALSVIKVTSPAAVAGYDRWVALVGTSSNGEYIQATNTFGSDYNEAAGGFNNTTTSPYDDTYMPNGVTAYELPGVSTTFYYYPFYDIPNAFVAFADRGVTVKSEVNAAAQNADTRTGLSAGGTPAATPGAGLTTSGTMGGGKYQ